MLRALGADDVETWSGERPPEAAREEGEGDGGLRAVEEEEEEEEEDDDALPAVPKSGKSALTPPSGAIASRMLVVHTAAAPFMPVRTAPLLPKTSGQTHAHWSPDEASRGPVPRW
jgi:hypothetical protein